MRHCIALIVSLSSRRHDNGIEAHQKVLLFEYEILCSSTLLWEKSLTRVTKWLLMSHCCYIWAFCRLRSAKSIQISKLAFKMRLYKLNIVSSVCPKLNWTHPPPFFLDVLNLPDTDSIRNTVSKKKYLYTDNFLYK